MFNTIVQPTGVYANLAHKMPQNFPAKATMQAIQPEAQQSKAKESRPVVSKQKTQKRKTGIFPKLVILAFVATGVIWGIPAINKAILNAENNLPKQEKELKKKIQKLISKGAETVQSDKISLEKEEKRFELKKRIFNKINKTPALNTIKGKLASAAEFMESKIKKPFRTFVQNHIFGFVKRNV